MIGGHRQTIDLSPDVGDFMKGVAERELRETQENVSKGLKMLKDLIRGRPIVQIAYCGPQFRYLKTSLPHQLTQTIIWICDGSSFKIRCTR